MTKEAAAEITRQREAAKAAEAAAEKRRTAAASTKKPRKKKGGQKKPTGQPEASATATPPKTTQRETLFSTTFLLVSYALLGKNTVTVNEPKATVPKAEEIAHNQSSETDPEEVKRLLRAENKRLRQINELEERQKKGEKLNADQLAKLQRRAEVEALIEKLSNLAAS
ncbi:unnamed protein product [Dibothriocephalus latus]|uniref:Uncharacterized protein n=1 Tax=Dibothriocephalus latus TaxID=60516 RepID=A0A3P7MAY4_DIBLA|nr:unnamed protein product [Dibothriocephalus latus]